MATFISVITLTCSIFLTPFLLFFCGIILFSTFGISIGFSKLYVSFLLKVFEYGRESIEKTRQRKSSADSLEEEDDDEDDEDDIDDDDDDEQQHDATDVVSRDSDPSYMVAAASSIANNHSAEAMAVDGTEVTSPAEAIIGINHHNNTTYRNSNSNATSNGDLNKRICNGNCVYNITPALAEQKKHHHSNNKPKNGYVNGANSVISRKKDFILLPEPSLNYNFNRRKNVQRDQSLTDSSKFELPDVFDYIKAGVEAIIEDEVTSRFEAEELKTWNLLTRTNRNYEFINWKITAIWVVGFWLRYMFLLPLRTLTLFFGVMWLTICTALVGYVPNGLVKKWLNQRVSILCFKVLSNTVSCLFTYNNPENKPKNGICVANHTTPIDVLVLACDNCYSLIGQRHGGFLGIFQRALARASPHIWFERSEVKDREAVTARLRKHISNPDNPPILIFPEGTCINNTSVMQFKKGSFEIGGVVYPVAMKYDPRFGDAFWNSSKYSMMQYIYMMMTSWAIVCEVWYLPPMTRLPDETAVQFANRVKRAIAEQGGLVDLMWDGQLKRMKPKKEWKEHQQEEFSKRLKAH